MTPLLLTTRRAIAVRASKPTDPTRRVRAVRGALLLVRLLTNKGIQHLVLKKKRTPEPLAS
jgi:hypothetical protein